MFHWPTELLQLTTSHRLRPLPRCPLSVFTRCYSTPVHQAVHSGAKSSRQRPSPLKTKHHASSLSEDSLLKKIDSYVQQAGTDIRIPIEVQLQDDLNHYSATKTADDARWTQVSEQLVLEKVMALLMLNNCFELAESVYDRMRRLGHTPSPAAAAEAAVMRFCRSIKSSSGPSNTPSVYQDVKRAFSHPSYNESLFLHVLHILKSMDAGAAPTAEVIDLFLKARAPSFVPSRMLVSKYVEALTASGATQRATEIIQRYVFDESHPGAFDPGAAAPYAAILRGLSDVPPDAADAADQMVNYSLQLMRMRGIDTDVDIFNALILRELHRENWAKVFHLYDVIQGLAGYAFLQTRMKRDFQFLYHNSITAGPGAEPRYMLLPDSATFQNMFYALAMVHRPLLTRKSRRQIQEYLINVLPRGAVHTYQLYHDMLCTQFNSMFKRKSSSLSLAYASLHSALRCFLALRNYAGAVVVIQNFSRFGIAVQPPTYFYVIRHIIARIHDDLVDNSEQDNPDGYNSNWVNIFLGGEVDNAASWEDDALATRILQWGIDSVDLPVDCTYSPTRTASTAASSRLPSIPTWEKIKDESPTSRYLIPNSAPLENLLRRAVWACFCDKWDTLARESPEARELDQQTPDDRVKYSVEKAAKAMVPENIRFWVWHQDWRRGVTRIPQKPVAARLKTLRFTRYG